MVKGHQELPGVSFIRAWIPIMRAPPYDLITSQRPPSPNTITLGVSEFWILNKDANIRSLSLGHYVEVMWKRQKTGLKDGDDSNKNNNVHLLSSCFMLLSYLIFNDSMQQLLLFYRCGNCSTESLSSKLHTEWVQTWGHLVVAQKITAQCIEQLLCTKHFIHIDL